MMYPRENTNWIDFIFGPQKQRKDGSLHAGKEIQCTPVFAPRNNATFSPNTEQNGKVSSVKGVRSIFCAVGVNATIEKVPLFERGLCK